MILHADLDAFYAAVEQRRRPGLAGRPVAVGATGPRGVVMSASYEARASGVESGQPVVRARRVCPELVVVAPDMDEYAVVSANVMAVLSSFSRKVEPASLDEAYLDLAGVPFRPRVLAELLRERVWQEQRLALSVGVGPNKLIAKLASVAAKPDGLLVVTPAEVPGFLLPLPATRLPGVGPSTTAALTRFGLTTVADLAATPPDTLRRIVGAAAGEQLARFARGEDLRPVVPQRAERSLGGERTFPADVSAEHELIRTTLLRLAESAAARLRAAGVAGRTVTVKVRFADLRTVTRSRTLPEPVDLAHDLYATAVQVFDGMGLARARIRLIGLRVEGLGQGARPQQMALGEREHGWSELERTVDRVRAKFGTASVGPASLLEPGREVAREPGREVGKEPGGDAGKGTS
ncbi:DNA polymerase IV [Streptacidiphilus fuscans]|uniref:DNA polymerase IV n=1 Tax=Streptacidiphilus fuscans TaxID=2789292 RepID=A0A931B8J0_9ACTN|nr:DNA polymerase IV [Streptacidiphilus fuscans]MBF9070996.1 DNA polymerase IV [Streptacidiphilus fuscans]